MFERYNQIIETRFKSNDTKEEKFLKDLIAGFLVWRCKSENIEIGCHSVNNISMENYCIFKTLSCVYCGQFWYFGTIPLEKEITN